MFTQRFYIGFDGGQRQRFIMEIFDQQTNVLQANISSLYPIFTVNGLDPNKMVKIIIYAFNVKGRSDSVMLEASTLKAVERESRTGKQFISTAYIREQTYNYCRPRRCCHPHFNHNHLSLVCSTSHCPPGQGERDMEEWVSESLRVESEWNISTEIEILFVFFLLLFFIPIAIRLLSPSSSNLNWFAKYTHTHK